MCLSSVLCCRRWESALRHLAAAGEEHFGQALALARDKGLLRLLLQLQQGKPPAAPAAGCPLDFLDMSLKKIHYDFDSKDIRLPRC